MVHRMSAIRQMVDSLTSSDGYSQRLLAAHNQHERADLFARLKAMYLDEHPNASGHEFEAYAGELAKELRL